MIDIIFLASFITAVSVLCVWSLSIHRRHRKTRPRWQVVTDVGRASYDSKPDENKIRVCLKDRKGYSDDIVVIAKLDPKDDDFDDLLIKAQEAAEDRVRQLESAEGR